MHKQYDNMSADTLIANPMELASLANLGGNHQPWARGLIGAWRWSIVQKHKQTIHNVVTLPYVIDFGGEAGRIGYNAIVVDYEGQNKSLLDLPGQASAIFSCHTVEHVKDLRLLSIMFDAKIQPGGWCVVIVPSFKKELLQAGNWPYHEHTFCLERHSDQPDSYVRLERLFDGWADVKLADEDDANLIVIAQKNSPPVPEKE